MATNDSHPQVDPSILPEHLPEALVPQPEATKLDAVTVNVAETSGSSSSSSSASVVGEKPEEKYSFDPAALKARYDTEREKRLAANPSGVDQYRLINDGDPIFGHYLQDPYIKNPIQRDPIDSETEVLIVGGGYGGQLCAVKLHEKGITDFKIIEKGGDFGGTWYWNRYPGVK